MPGERPHPALTSFVTYSARARTEQQGVRWPHRRRADRFFLFRLFADGVEAIDRSIDVDRPLSS